MVTIVHPFPQLVASASGESNIAEGGPETKPNRTILFSTAFPENSNGYRIYKALYSEIFKRMGYDFRMIYHPESRELIEVNAGHVDGCTGRIYNIDPENQFPNLVCIPKPITSHSGIGLAKDKKIRIDGWESLKGYKVVHIIDAGWIENFLPSYVEEENIIRASDYKHALRILDQGRADVQIELYEILKLLMRPMNLETRVF